MVFKGIQCYESGETRLGFNQLLSKLLRYSQT